MPKIQTYINWYDTNGALFWMLASQFKGQLYHDYDQYTIYANDPSIAALVTDRAKEMDAKDKPVT